MNMETGGFGGDDRRKYIVPALIVAAALVVLLLILGIGALIRSRGGGGTATATVTRTVARPPIIGSPSAAATRTTVLPSTAASPRPSTAPSTAPSAAPAAGASYIVANTGGDNINMRSSASASAEVVARLAAGDQIVEIGPVATADGREWRRVRTKDGIEGWVAAEFTAPAP